jgi:drug/metabolite transporter (DMT)-like permease
VQASGEHPSQLASTQTSRCRAQRLANRLAPWQAIIPFRVTPRSWAVTEGIAANALWSSSFVFIKIGLEQIGPLTLAGARYSLAGIILLPWMFVGTRQLRRLTPRQWLGLVLIGLTGHTIGNGAWYIGLHYFTATSLTFLTTLGPFLSLALSLAKRKDVPSPVQVLGLIITLA